MIKLSLSSSRNCWASILSVIAGILFEIHLPLGLEPINILALGYTEEKADANRHESQRIPMKEFISFL